jgi:hypothetical protein
MHAFESYRLCDEGSVPFVATVSLRQAHGPLKLLARVSTFQSAPAIDSGMAQIHSSSKPSANDTAAPASFIFSAVNRAMRPPILLLGTVWRLSKFAAQVFGNPSSCVKTTSVGILRTVEVMGATVTECSTAIAELRVRISTGRFLSGALNVYQQTSPRFTMRPSPVR